MPFTRPRILINVAMTADGKIDTFERKGAAISSAADKARVDRLRAEVDAIMVGGRTLLDEDPKLTVRSAELRRERVARGLVENPAKVGVVTDLALAAGPGDRSEWRREPPLRNFLGTGPAKVFLFTTRCNDPELLDYFHTSGAKVSALGHDRVDLLQVFASLHQEGIRTVLVEGGGTLLAELFRLGLVDELTIYVAPRVFGGANAPTLADGPGFSLTQAPHLKLQSVGAPDDQGGIVLHYSVEQQE
jgi:2,5-diamino-6-(ribosylamino)-4(3H)-pyrimidinone 5'-phosphate reductase